MSKLVTVEQSKTVRMLNNPKPNTYLIDWHINLFSDLSFIRYYVIRKKKTVSTV